MVVPPEMTQGGLLALTVPKISRREALTVPAVLRARNLICATLGGLPMRLHGPDRAVRPSRLLEQPEADVPRSVTMTRTYEDLLLDGIAWWRVQAFGWDGFPSEARRLEPGSVHVAADGRVYVDGHHVEDGELIRFDSPNPALLDAGARAIRTCLKLDAAAGRYADEPLPLAYFTPNEGADPADDTTVEAVLDDWAAARNSRATGYVPAALTLNTVSGFSPEQLQLADARQHAVLEIARATGLDAEDLGVSTTSRTYQNAEGRRLDLLDFTLGHYVSAVQDRLTMLDVTARGSYVKVAFEGFLRSDATTRMAVYKAGLEVGAFADTEIRELEDKPALTPAQRKAATPPPPASPTPAPTQQEQPMPQQQHAPAAAAAFAAPPAQGHLTFEVPAVVESFRVDAHARTVTGLVVPYGPIADNGHGRWRFQRGALKFADTKRVKLLRDHDPAQPLGVLTKATESDAGMTATFKVARGPDGDAALALAEDGVLDGFSVGISWLDDGSGWQPDPTDEGVRLVQAAAWRETSLTPFPSFDSARVAGVKASAPTPGRDLTMSVTAPEQTAPPVPAPTAPDFAAFTAAVKAFTTAVASLGQTREVIPAGRAVITREEPVYQYGAAGMRGQSFVRDAFKARIEGDTEAAARLHKWQRQLADEAAQFRARQDVGEFATVNRTVGANVIPPGYRPELYQPQLFQDRPLYAMVSQGSLTDATPFTLPAFTSATGATADHVEGTNPTDGTLVIGTKTVTPGAISGLFKITREVIDAANPAIDAIALAAMRESYSQQTEGKVYTELNGANGQGGVITAGLVPSGVTVIAVTGVGATGAAGATLLDTVRDQVVAYPFRRFAAPNRLALSAEAAQQFAKAKDSTGRPLLPRLGAMNAVGTVSTLSQAFDVDGLPGVPAWSMTGNAAGDADTILWNAMDVWAWESDLLTFRYEERSGPAIVELALFGYFAVRILRPGGFSAIRLTVT